MSEEVKITPEALKKSFDLLDEALAIVKSKEENKLDDVADPEKEEVAPTEEEIKKAKETAEFLNKAGVENDKVVDILVKGGISEQLAKDTMVGFTVTPEKDVAVESLGKFPDISEEIKKSLDPVIKENAALKDSISKGLEGINQIIKSFQESNLSLIEDNKKLVERIEKIERTPEGRKSVVTATAVEKFAKSEDVAKDENYFNVNDINDLTRLTDRLALENENKIQKSGKGDPMLEGAISTIECTRNIPERFYRPFAAMGIKLYKN